jgi:hypothetical protein
MAETAAPALDWTAELADQLAFHWTNQLRPRLDGLTDEEYRWEPVPGCWSLRPRAEATTAMAAGAGDLVLDFEYPEPEPAPVTTIAWRLGHLIVGVLGMRVANHFGGPPMDYRTYPWPATASGALAALDEVYEQWMTGITGVGPERLAAPAGPSEGPYQDHTFAALILHINREMIHHGAEIALLRDLFTATRGAPVTGATAG